MYRKFPNKNNLATLEDLKSDINNLSADQVSDLNIEIQGSTDERTKRAKILASSYNSDYDQVMCATYSSDYNARLLASSRELGGLSVLASKVQIRGAHSLKNNATKPGR